MAIVRGERPWRSLLPLGFSIERHEDGWTFTRLGPGSVVPAVADVVSGFFADSSPSQRIEWASFILGASSLISLQAVEAHQDGDFLLEVLWSTSFGDELSKDAWQKLRQLDRDR